MKITPQAEQLKRFGNGKFSDFGVGISKKLWVFKLHIEGYEPFELTAPTEKEVLDIIAKRLGLTKTNT